MKVLVAHPAQQHSYRLATALKRIGALDKYSTTVYYKKGNLTFFVAKLLRGSFRVKAEARCCDELTDSDVLQFCEAEGLLKLLALNTRFLKRYYYKIKYHTADRFAKKVAKYAIRHHVDAVVSFDDSSPILFERLKEKAPSILRIMDMSSANLLYLRRIYENDMMIATSFADRMKRERSICWDTGILNRSLREIEATQKFLVPSEFVADSLEFSGVNRDQMFRCPYGVDVSMFSAKTYDDLKRFSRPIRFIYVGGVKELKGIYYLLEAFSEISPDIASLTVVGSYDEKDKDTAPYSNRVSFTGSILHSAVADELRKADVFVFASLGEGLSLSTLEAAACGLPLIVTENSGVNDEMTDGIEGFIIPIQSKEAIKEKVIWFVEHPDKIAEMGRAARKFALSFTWDAYYSKIETIFSLLSNQKCIEINHIS